MILDREEGDIDVDRFDRMTRGNVYRAAGPRSECGSSGLRESGIRRRMHDSCLRFKCKGEFRETMKTRGIAGGFGRAMNTDE